MSMIQYLRRITPDELASIRKDPSMIEDLLHNDPESDIDIEKAWHGIHFLLTGTVWEVSYPLGAAILGGEPIGDDIGYGPACFLTPDQVKEIAEALASVSIEKLKQSFDPQRMMELEIYPVIWDEKDEDPLDYLIYNYEILKDYYLKAAKQGDAMLLYLA